MLHSMTNKIKRCKVCGMQFGSGIPYLDVERHLDTHIYKDLWEEI